MSHGRLLVIVPVIAVAVWLGVAGGPRPWGAARYVLAGVVQAVIDFGTQVPDLLITGVSAGDSFGTDAAAGDLDGDGIQDLVVGAPWAEGVDGSTWTGRVYVFFGGEDRPAAISAGDADVVIVGATEFEALGGDQDRVPGTIAGGDLNGDNIGDLVLGVPRAGDGQVRVLFGRSRSEWLNTPLIDLASRQQPGDVVISAADPGDRLGRTVAVGDVNNDGFGDLVASAPQADGVSNNRRTAGEVYVFFGASTWAAGLGADDADLRVIGADSLDFLGRGLAVGQLGGGPAMDIAIGATGGKGPPGDARNNAGEVQVIFGSSGLGGVRDLATAPGDHIVYGADASDALTRYIAIGDVNASGDADLALGVPNGDGLASAPTQSGEVVVIFGPLAAGTSDLSQAAAVDFAIYGPEWGASMAADDRFGETVSLADFNGDGVADIMAGAPQGDGPGNSREDAGEAFVVSGGTLPAAHDLSSQPAALTLYGPEPDAFFGRVLGADLDGVGPADIAVGAREAEEARGQVFVLYPAVEPSPTPSPTRPTGVSPTPTRTATVTLTPTRTVTPTPSPSPTPGTFDYLPLILRNHDG